MAFGIVHVITGPDHVSAMVTIPLPCCDVAVRCPGLTQVLLLPGDARCRKRIAGSILSHSLRFCSAISAFNMTDAAPRRSGWGRGGGQVSSAPFICHVMPRALTSRSVPVFFARETC
eukprot:3617310-Rhodomonas_salina.1